MGAIVLGVGTVLGVRRPPRWAGLAAVLALALLPGAVRSTWELTRLSTHGMQANHAIPKVLEAESAVLVGPYASFLALGHGIERRRAGDFRTDSDAYFAMTLQLLKPDDAPWATHLAVDAGQERNAQAVKRFSQRGLDLHAVAVLTPYGPRGIPVFVFRFPWAQERGYPLSPHELRLVELTKEGDEAGAAALRNTFASNDLR